VAGVVVGGEPRKLFGQIAETRVEEIQKLILNVVIPKVNQLNVAIIWWYNNFLI
jgi:hypothetical protein